MAPLGGGKPCGFIVSTFVEPLDGVASSWHDEATSETFRPGWSWHSAEDDDGDDGDDGAVG